MGPGDSQEDTRYYFEYEIGQWQFGRVQVLKEKATGLKRICKTVRKNPSMDPNKTRAQLQRLQKLEHQNICKLVEVVEDDDSWYLVTEHCDGGDLSELLERMDDHAWLEEGTVAIYIRQLLEATAFCHAAGVQHRDLNMRALGLTSKLPDACLKVSDFGFAALFDPHDSFPRDRPQPLTAPELLDGEAPLSKQSDSWSIGALCYTLLIREMPFASSVHESAFDMAAAMRGRLCFFREDGWGDRSNQSRDFIRKLMNPEPGNRITAAQALTHPWISAVNSREIPFQRMGPNPEDLHGHGQVAARALVMTTGALLVPMVLENNELERLRSAFLMHDSDRDGFLVRFEAIAAFSSFGMNEDITTYALGMVDVLGRGIHDLCGFIVAYLIAQRFPGFGSCEDLTMKFQEGIYQGCHCRGHLLSKEELRRTLARRPAQWFEAHTGVVYNDVIDVLSDSKPMDPQTFVQDLMQGSGQGVPAAAGAVLQELEDYETEDLSDDDLDDMPWTVRFQENLPSLMNIPFVLCGTHCNSGGKYHRRDSSPHSLRLF